MMSRYPANPVLTFERQNAGTVSTLNSRRKPSFHVGQTSLISDWADDCPLPVNLRAVKYPKVTGPSAD